MINILTRYIRKVKDRIDFKLNSAKMLDPSNRKGQLSMPEGYSIDGQRRSQGGQLAFLNQKFIEAQLRKTAQDNALAAAIPSDEELNSTIRTHHQHMRSILDQHIEEVLDHISRLSGSPVHLEETASEIAAQKVVLARLQDIRVHMFGSRYDDGYEEVNDVLLRTHEELSEDQEESEVDSEEEEEEDEKEEDPEEVTPSTASADSHPRLSRAEQRRQNRRK